MHPTRMHSSCPIQIERTKIRYRAANKCQINLTTTQFLQYVCGSLNSEKQRHQFTDIFHFPKPFSKSVRI